MASITEEDVGMLSAKDTDYEQYQKLGRNGENRLLPPWLGTSASGTVNQELPIVLQHPGLSWFAVAAQGNRGTLW